MEHFLNDNFKINFEAVKMDIPGQNCGHLKLQSI